MTKRQKTDEKSLIDNYIVTPTFECNLKQISNSLGYEEGILLEGERGCGKTSLIEYLALLNGKKLIKLSVSEQVDIKGLVGTYVCTDIPGEFKWLPGLISSCMIEGKWLLIEDIDMAPSELLSLLLPILESRSLVIPSRGQKIVAKDDFRLFATRISSIQSAKSTFNFVGSNLWDRIELQNMSLAEFSEILEKRFPNVKLAIECIMKAYQNICEIRGAKFKSIRSLFKWVERLSFFLNIKSNCLDEENRIAIANEFINCFVDSVSSLSLRTELIEIISRLLYLEGVQLNNPSLIQLMDKGSSISIGTVSISKKKENLKSATDVCKFQNFAYTSLSKGILEKLAKCVILNEPVLLVGETGTGKTTIVQQLSYLTNQPQLIVVNLNQQTDSSDLLGGFKSCSASMVVRPLNDDFFDLFCSCFSKKQNSSFLANISESFLSKSWERLITLYRQAVSLAFKKELKPEMASQWHSFSVRVNNLEKQLNFMANNMLFSFVEGILVKAIKQGHWILLDEVNLASLETLEVLSGLLDSKSSSVTLLEKGEFEPVKRHENFRLFACMNPSTDVNKKDLPLGIKSRFTEIYVDEVESVRSDLRMVVEKYLEKVTGCSSSTIDAVCEFYYSIKSKAALNEIVDGSMRRPLYSLRTLSRAMNHSAFIAPVYGLKRSLYEGLYLAFGATLDRNSSELCKKLICSTIFHGDDIKAILSIKPSKTSISMIYKNYSLIDDYFIQNGPKVPLDHSDERFVLTAGIKRNLLNICRAAVSQKYPILLQGPTASGKTSLVEYLALATGNVFVRINNHEHTDIQEYIGSYLPDEQGKLVFQEGLLVKAVRHGYWLVLDELNLAPSDILEALNRLLDDNRELFIPETQEVVTPHPNFMLFATQNPSGSIYGGRKMLSRAFRNRFIELFFDEIPDNELVEIIHKKCRIPESWARKLCSVYISLNSKKSNNIFAGKHAFITIRDLFRWANREAVTEEALARNGFMLIAEKLRAVEERAVVAEVFNNVFKYKICDENFYDVHWQELIVESGSNVLSSSISWTKSMKRLFVLVYYCWKYNEPILLVGETGCGKTTVCQAVAEFFKKALVIINCHQNSETSDFLGNQRPCRSQASCLFEWCDGPLVRCMKEGLPFLIDEISLADDSVLERLNSVLEPSRTLTLAEKCSSNIKSDEEVIVSHADFKIMATMNPGGDFGKKELSPALRNRFTEIWVFPFSDADELTDILSQRSKLADEKKLFAISKIVSSFFFCKNHPIFLSSPIGLRDLITWVEFVNLFPASVEEALLHGGLMVICDNLGVQKALKPEEKSTAISQFCSFLGISDNLLQKSIEIVDGKFGIDPFWIPCENSGSCDFSFSAPTTKLNSFKVLRAMQCSRPILLEGSPGVGKTCLVASLAQTTGNNLVRINLSEQTDLIDLFGTDLPTENGNEISFSWFDGPFLKALKNGDWILLDEMNLASQSILEGLNACFDHRGTVYIPELDKEFKCSTKTRIFAAQNPLGQGGGRKGLPKSFLNRFTKVFVEPLTLADYEIICHSKYPQFDKLLLQKMISFNHEVHEKACVQRSLGHSGSPWEFNLRDVLKWLELCREHQNPQNFIELIYCARFRTNNDRLIVRSLGEKYFGIPAIERYCPDYSFTNSLFQVGHGIMERKGNSINRILHQQLAALESLIFNVNKGWLSILVGETSVGKTSVIKLIADLAGKQLNVLSMNNLMDTSELLGGYEQTDPFRYAFEIVEIAERHGFDTTNLRLIIEQNDLRCFVDSCHSMHIDNSEFSSLLSSLESIVDKNVSGRFEWVDSILVKSIKKGDWIILDNVNFCPSSVLDRLNSLFEAEGFLALNEKGSDCDEKLIPHPEFRAFMTIDPSFGEISRAMRN